ncbi:unnamed protein product, partial [Effrenium voratum]
PRVPLGAAHRQQGVRAEPRRAHGRPQGPAEAHGPLREVCRGAAEIRALPRRRGEGLPGE